MRLWDHVEKLARAYTIKGTRLWTNLAPNAPRGEWGLLVDPLPSDRIREGPLFEAVQRLLPVRTTTVQCNKFTSHEQCKFHVDKRNVGDSFLAILGDCEGGALRLADGRHFAQKRCWHVYNGSQVGHVVEPFLSLIHI